ncbi:hypothetical protein BDZ91DRAFT_744587 [Kalaharituber pfeilii]|nr:hypothetical protein BDZ91DRAFT_744587 [Kalaharituber pfeilii]
MLDMIGIFAIGISAILIKGSCESLEKLCRAQERLRKENEAAIHQQKEYMDDFKQEVERLKTSNHLRPKNAEVQKQKLIDVLEKNLDRTVESVEVRCRTIVKELPEQVQEEATQDFETRLEWVKPFRKFLKGILDGMRAVATTILAWLESVGEKLKDFGTKIVNSAQDAIQNIRNNTKLLFCNVASW